MESPKLDAYFLYSLGPGKYHLLPPHSIRQEVHNKQFTLNKKLKASYIYENDGSRLMYLHLSKDDPIDALFKINTLIDDLPSIILHENTDEEGFMSWLTQGIKEKKFIYVFYQINKFLDKTRLIPIAYSTETQTYVDLSPYMQHIRDTELSGFGIILNDDNYMEEFKAVLEFLNITLEEVDKYSLIDYRASYRMCPCCGVVSNMDKTKKNPWVGHERRS